MADRSDYFAWGAGTVVTQCAYCVHLVREAPLPCCAAFPGAIPPEILANDFDHRRPWIDPATGEPGDMGIPLERSITFTPRDGVRPRTLAALYAHLDRP